MDERDYDHDDDYLHERGREARARQSAVFGRRLSARSEHRAGPLARARFTVALAEIFAGVVYGVKQPGDGSKLQ